MTPATLPGLLSPWPEAWLRPRCLGLLGAALLAAATVPLSTACSISEASGASADLTDSFDEARLFYVVVIKARPRDVPSVLLDGRFKLVDRGMGRRLPRDNAQPDPEAYLMGSGSEVGRVGDRAAHARDGCPALDADADDREAALQDVVSVTGAIHPGLNDGAWRAA
jgi:hypothetical protein